MSYLSHLREDEEKDVRLGSSYKSDCVLTSGTDQNLGWNSLFPTPLTQILAENPIKRDKYQADSVSVSKGLVGVVGC